MRNFVAEVGEGDISLVDAIVQLTDLLEDRCYMNSLSDSEQINLYKQEELLMAMMMCERAEYMKRYGYVLDYKIVDDKIIHFWNRIMHKI